jgi:hypothetical protein
MKLLVNFTVKQEDTQIQVAPLLDHWNINADTNRSDLSFLNDFVGLDISGNPPEPADAVDQAGTLGNDMNGVTAVMGIVGTMSVALSVVSAGAPSGPIV